MRIVYFLLNIREMKRGPLPELSEEIPGRNLYRGRNIKAVYDQVLEITKARACLAIITHRGDSLSLMARVVADLGIFQALLEHKLFKKTAIYGRIKDIHPFRLEKQDPLWDSIGFRNQCCDRIINAILRKAKSWWQCGRTKYSFKVTADIQLTNSSRDKWVNQMDYNKMQELFIKNFIIKDRRERCESQLKDSKKWVKFTDRLNHQLDTILNIHFLIKIPSGVIDYDFVIKELKFKGNELCYIISNHDDIDGETTNFNDAFDKVYGRSFGSLIINSTADKLYLETEVVQGKQNRFIGKRTAAN